MASRMRGLIVPTLLVLAALAVLISLGSWQVRRLAWKENLIAMAVERPLDPIRDLPRASAWSNFEVAEGEYRRYRLTGSFLHDKEALVFTSLAQPKGSEGGPGYWVVTPFALAEGGIVLANRGFAPQGRQRPQERGESLSHRTVTVVGLMRSDETRNFFLPDDRPAENVFYARSIADIAEAKGISASVAPFTIDLVAAETPPGGLPQAGETRVTFTNNHLQYAITWYGLAAALLTVFASFAWRRLRDGTGKPCLTRPGRAS